MSPVSFDLYIDAIRERDSWKEDYEAMQRVGRRQSERADAAEDALRALSSKDATRPTGDKE